MTEQEVRAQLEATLAALTKEREAHDVTRQLYVAQREQLARVTKEARSWKAKAEARAKP